VQRVLGTVAGAVVVAALLTPATTAAASVAPSRAHGPLGGAAALERVSGHLPAAAARNRMSATQLRGLLLRDRTARLDEADRLLYVDAHTPAPVTAATRTTAAATYPYAQTFALHSRPGASRVIYLDFDGEVVQGTAWNSSGGLSTARQPAFDTDGDPSSFSDAERALVQSVWERVSEDYAPFEVDVTTAAPTAAALQRSTSTDTTYGTRVLISPSAEAFSKLCPQSCGGVAYVGMFDAVQPDASTSTPAWVFPQVLYGDAKYLAEAVSHEAGHTLGLQHDGTATADYADGQGAWAPIMGTGYGRPVTQWSMGEYEGADNRQDDVAVMSGHGLPVRTDDHGDTPAAATKLALPATATGVISARGDQDAFTFTSTCAGTVAVSARPALSGPDLDVRLRLIGPDGRVAAADDPVSSMSSYEAARGLAAAISTSAPAGTYTVEVDGVGAQDPLSTGYSDYASLGSYSLDVSACVAPAAAPVTAPSAPRIGTAVAGTAGGAVTAKATWSAPTSTGSSAVTGYVVRALRLSSTGTVLSTTTSARQPATARALSMTVPTAGSYRFTVTAISAAGSSARSARSNLVAGR